MSSQITNDPKKWQWPENMYILQEKFKAGKPFPHICLDNVFPEDVLQKIYSDVPPSSSPLWTSWGSGAADDCLPRNSKKGISSLLFLSTYTGEFLKLLNSDTFIQDLMNISGIRDLSADPTLNGGGLHCTGRGGRLRVHVDKVRHTRPALFDQALNLILFINPDWKTEYGGFLEFWSQDGSERVVSILPQFNRLVLFYSDHTSYHGQPQPLTCPDGMYRTSLAIYYYVPRLSQNTFKTNEIIWI